MQLNLYLFREVEDPMADGMKESFDQYEEVEVQDPPGSTLKLFVRTSKSRAPRWLSDLNEIIIDKNPPKLLNKHSGALLFIEYGDQNFLLSYGSGHFCINRESTERGFGLRVTANCLASNEVISADTRGLDSRARSQRVILSRSSPFYELGIEPSEDLIKQLSGKPGASPLAAKVSGGDSLKLNVERFSLKNLTKKLDEIIDLYHSKDYVEKYGFLDNFVAVPREEKQLISHLKGTVAQKIKEESTDFELAAPEILEPLSVDHTILVSGNKKSSEIPELTRDALFTALREWPNISNPLESVRVRCFDSAGSEVGDRSYRLYDYIVAETIHSESRYSLSAGSWYKIANDYVEKVQEDVQKIPDISDELNMPVWVAADGDEGFYNRLLTKAMAGKLMDTKNYYGLGGPNQKVEICDVLTANRHLICVKRMRSSSTLSHLFEQGLVTAQLLVSDIENYRKRVLDDLSEISDVTQWDGAEQWTIVYAIATDKDEPLHNSLYFFSKVALSRVARALRSTGVGLALAKIPLDGGS